ncbi:MAG: hypothetical protein ACI91R_001611, partial [Vicingaceae bacterium]
EKGAQQKRVVTEHIDSSKGSAVGYIAKYIAKNIDGENVGADLYGFDAIDSATRIRAWASTWKIRQFQSIGGPSVIVWREARKFSRQELSEDILNTIGDEKLKAIITAADDGNWQAFVNLLGGPTASRKEQPLRAHHIKKERPNKYGELIKQIKGIVYQGAQKIITRIRTWEVRPVAINGKANAFDSCFSLGGANAPPLEFCQ